ncbi:MAG: ABC transporter substrate-binding protein [Firmicutes bacterium]|nr:ABC transporter substrate-binding protein [Bacillota bacterium]
MRKNVKFAAVIAAVLGVLVGLSIFNHSISTNEREISIAVPTDPDSFDPTYSVAAATAEIAFNIYEGLVKSTPDGQVVGALASHWEIDSSLTKYTFFLREAYFHNGKLVTPDDVVNSINRARDPKISQRASRYQAIKDVYADEDRIIIVLKEPYAPLLYELTELSAVIYPKDADGLANKPIGTGPYKFVEWRPNQYIKLTRYAEHWSKQSPYYKDVYFRIMPDTNTVVLSIKTGVIDLIPRLEADYLHQVESDAKLKVQSAPMNLVQILAVNNAHPVLKDKRVRQAIAMAIDRDEIIYGAAWGQGDKIFSGLSPAMPEFFHNQLEEVLPYNPDQAQQLLSEAGYSDLELTIDLPSAYPLHVQTGEIIADQLSRVGINVNIQIIEWGTWLERVYNQRDYELTVTGLTGKLDPHTILSRYVSTEPKNFTNFNNPEFDQLIKQGVGVLAAERTQIYKKAQEILTEDVAGVFIMDPKQLTVTKNDIYGWQNYPVYVIDVASLYKHK